MLSLFIIIPVLIAVFLFVFTKNQVARILAIVFQAVYTGFAGWLVLQTRGTYIIERVGGYEGVLGILLYAFDTSAIFILLTAVLFLVISIYSFHETEQRTFWCLLFLLQGALAGVFLTRDLFNIFVMVEVSTIVVIILMMYYRGRRNMFTGMVYLMGNIIAMQLYLFGLGYIYMMAGGFDIDLVRTALAYADPADLVLPYALIMTGLAFKAGLIPLISVVPKARLYPGAPSAVAAILSGIQIKAAVFLFMRFQDMFGPIAQQHFFLIIGIITGATGVILAMSQKDIKMILAYHTVSQVGLIMIGLSAGPSAYYSYTGGMYHMIAHGIFKAALFLTAGIIRRSYGTSNVYKIRGVFKRMPVVGIASAFAILSITGAPFFIGSISKYFLTSGAPPLVEYSIIIISVGTIISFIKYGSMLFGKEDPSMKGSSVKPDVWRVIPAVLLAALCLLGGVFGPQAINFMFPYSGVSVSEGLLGNWAYYQKALIFAGSAVVGFVLYKFVVKGNKFLDKISQMDLNFRTILVSSCAFVGLLIVVAGLL